MSGPYDDPTLPIAPDDIDTRPSSDFLRFLASRPGVVGRGLLQAGKQIIGSPDAMAPKIEDIDPVAAAQAKAEVPAPAPVPAPTADESAGLANVRLAAPPVAAKATGRTRAVEPANSTPPSDRDEDGERIEPPQDAPGEEPHPVVQALVAQGVNPAVAAYLADKKARQDELRAAQGESERRTRRAMAENAMLTLADESDATQAARIAAAGQPVRDVEARQKAGDEALAQAGKLRDFEKGIKADDPNDPAAVAMRSFYKGMGIDLPPNLTISQAGPLADNFLKRQAEQDKTKGEMDRARLQSDTQKEVARGNNATDLQVARINHPAPGAGSNVVASGWEDSGAVPVSKENRDKFQAKAAAAAVYEAKAKALRDEVAKGGVEKFGPRAAKLRSLHSDFTIAAKNAAQLGALSGSDMKLVDGLASDPTSWSNRGANIVAGIDQTITNSRIGLDAEGKALGFRRSGGGAPAQEERVDVVKADGSHASLPRSQVERARAAGAIR